MPCRRQGDPLGTCRRVEVDGLHQSWLDLLKDLAWGRYRGENHVLNVYERPRFPTCTIWVFPEVSSLVAQMVKNPPAMRESWVRSLCWEDPLEEGMAAHSGILAWRIPTAKFILTSHCPAHTFLLFTVFPLFSELCPA